MAKYTFVADKMLMGFFKGERMVREGREEQTSFVVPLPRLLPLHTAVMLTEQAWCCDCGDKPKGERTRELQSP